MTTPNADDLQELRAELRRLYLAAPGGTWIAPQDQALPGSIVSVGKDGSRGYIGALFYAPAAPQLADAARNALPRLFAEIDRLKRQTSLPVLGEIGEGGRIRWNASAGS